jgi:hypothetical protein
MVMVLAPVKRAASKERADTAEAAGPPEQAAEAQGEG